jgi:hypothetical protein
VKAGEIMDWATDDKTVTKYIFISKDNHDNPTVWHSQPGPIYKKIKVYYFNQK